MKKRILVVALILSMAVFLFACGGNNSSGGNDSKEEAPAEEAAEEAEAEEEPAEEAEEPAEESAAADVDPLQVTFNIAVSGEVYDNMSKIFADRCSELSGGKITVQIVAPTTLGSAREVVEATQLNTVNMIWAADSELDQVVENLSWAWLPYTITNFEDADKYYNEGWIDEAMAEICEGAGIKLVAGAENGFRLFAGKGAAPESLADISGLKIRIPEQQPLIQFYTLLGCNPSTITASESFAAMQQGTVDGSDNTLFNLYNLGFFDIIDYVEVINYQYSSGKICANLAWYNGLTDAQREIIDQAAEEAGMYQRNTLREMEQSMLDEAASKNITVAHPSEAFADEIREKAMVMWEEAYDQYDESVHQYIDKMIETFGN